MLENVKVVQIARMEEYLGDEAPLWSSEESLEDSVQDLEVPLENSRFLNPSHHPLRPRFPQ